MLFFKIHLLDCFICLQWATSTEAVDQTAKKYRAWDQVQAA